MKQFLTYWHRIDLGDGPAFDIGALRIVCLHAITLPRFWRNPNATGFKVGYLAVLYMQPAFRAIKPTNLGETRS